MNNLIDHKKVVYIVLINNLIIKYLLIQYKLYFMYILYINMDLFVIKNFNKFEK